MNPSTPLKTTESNDADNKPWRATLLSAAIISMAGLGDSFLYPALPLHADQLGVPVIWIGVLLSINKFVRLGGNYGVALGIGLLGYKRIAAVSVVLAALTTLLYGVNPPIWIWILSRLAWGMAYAALRMCSLGYATDNKENGLHLGISKAIREIGPMATLFIGPVIAAQRAFRQLSWYSGSPRPLSCRSRLRCQPAQVPSNQKYTAVSQDPIGSMAWFLPRPWQTGS